MPGAEQVSGDDFGFDTECNGCLSAFSGFCCSNNQISVIYCNT